MLRILAGETFDCYDEGVVLLVASTVSATQDFIAAVLPTLLFWKLQMPVRQKIALFAIFAIGYGVVALAIARAVFSFRIYYVTYDVTWETWNLFLVTLLELHVGAFCANAPAFKILFTHLLPEKLSLRSGGAGSSGKKESDNRDSSNLRRKASSKIQGMAAVLFPKGHNVYQSQEYDLESYTQLPDDVYRCVQIRRDVRVSHSPPLTASTMSFGTDVHIEHITNDPFFQSLPGASDVDLTRNRLRAESTLAPWRWRGGDREDSI